MRDFNYTVNVLVKAYLNDTLLHNDCCACAVGNLIADAIGAEIRIDGDPSRGTWSYETMWTRNKNQIQPIWDQVFCTTPSGQTIRKEEYKGWAKKQIDTVGYSLEELAAIEFAFEDGGDIEKQAPNDPEWMFNGLMAVVDVLADIHGIDLTQKEAAKLLFAK
jgi:hypothetical protein